MCVWVGGRASELRGRAGRRSVAFIHHSKSADAPPDRNGRTMMGWNAMGTWMQHATCNMLWIGTTHGRLGRGTWDVGRGTWDGKVIAWVSWVCCVASRYMYMYLHSPRLGMWLRVCASKQSSCACHSLQAGIRDQLFYDTKLACSCEFYHTIGRAR